MACLLSAVSSPVVAADNAHLQPRLELNHRYSNDRAITMGEMWLPLQQNTDAGSVLFADLRYMGDNNANDEFNLGLGYRELAGDGILRGDGMFDRRLTADKSEFNQITLGAEWLAERYDIRGNIYIPLDKDERLYNRNPARLGQGFVGNQILVNTLADAIEEALPGGDIELGYKLDFLDDLTDSTRLYAGGYHFEGDKADDVTGWRARVASDITSDIQLGARFQKDDQRGDQAYFEATIRFPFKAKKSFRKEGLRSRLDESPERDIDIVGNVAVLDDGIGKTLLSNETGIAQNVIHVDNTAAGGGDGTAETPFDTLAAAETAAGANDLIYVHRGDGTTTGQNAGITLDDEGQMLVGSGVDLTFDSGVFGVSSGDIGDGATIIATTTTAPVITNGAGDGVNVMADGISVSGITVDSATARGINVYNGSGLEWSKGITINNVTAQNNGTDGILVYPRFAGSKLDALLENNVATNNGRYGFYAVVNNTASVGEITFENNISKANTNLGFYAQVAGGSDGGKMNFTNNVSEGNTAGGGFNFRVNGGTGSASFINNTANNNAANGFQAWTSAAGSMLTASFSGNVADANNDNGYYAVSTDGIIDVDFSNNVAQRGGSTAYRIYSTGAGSRIDANLTDNVADDNNGTGFYVYQRDGAISVDPVSLVGNIAKNNVNYGYYLHSRLAGSVIDIRYIDNISEANGNDGFYALAQEDGSIGSVVFQGNTSVNNVASGINIDDNSAVGSIAADFGGGALGSTGGNRVYGNVGQEVELDLDGAELKAENNWWGVATGLAPAEILLIEASTVDADPFLAVDPN